MLDTLWPVSIHSLDQVPVVEVQVIDIVFMKNEQFTVGLQASEPVTKGKLVQGVFSKSSMKSPVMMDSSVSSGNCRSLLLSL